MLDISTTSVHLVAPIPFTQQDYYQGFTHFLVGTEDAGRAGQADALWCRAFQVRGSAVLQGGPGGCCARGNS